MPTTVTHILVPIILMSLFRDWYNSHHKKKLSLHYVLIAGLGGVLPDSDIIASLFAKATGFMEINNLFLLTHTIFFPLAFFILFLIFKPAYVKARICNIGRHKLKLSLISLMIAFGTLAHILLDVIFDETKYLFYPLSNFNFALNVLSPLPYEWWFLMAMLDGILLVVWITYLELKHKISDFI